MNVLEIDAAELVAKLNVDVLEEVIDTAMLLDEIEGELDVDRALIAVVEEDAIASVAELDMTVDDAMVEE